MDLNKEVDKMGKDVTDTVDEAKHRFKAGVEQGKRDARGEEMTTSEKVESSLKEAGHKTAAEVDKTKRNIRDNI